LTIIDEDGYPCYRRRDKRIFILKNGIKLDNRNVVLYSPLLLLRYQAHVNTEYCNKSNSIKYLFKYVNKDPDRANLKITNPHKDSTETPVIDEIKQYYDCRYISPCEAVWRIFAFDIHRRWPPVQRLTFHLLYEQPILFKDNEDIDEILHTNEHKIYPEGKNLTYSEYPNHFVWMVEQREWKPRKRGVGIGRLTYIPPGSRELYYLRLLLNFKKGCCNYANIRTINGVIYKMYKEACYAMGLLAEDKGFIDVIIKANTLASVTQLRRLFVTLLLMNTMSRPEEVWYKT